jgi:hypothetical protein
MFHRPTHGLIRHAFVIAKGPYTALFCTQDAFYTFQELADKYNETPVLLNGMACCQVFQPMYGTILVKKHAYCRGP